jgi:predicted ATPase
VVDTILHACARVHVLATSRELLAVEGESASRRYRQSIRQR